ncbi:MAG: tetratricopeptide repeat protein [Deltaproteobacteria bacterium]|nr:MAG: tetratricopeptide repeat protein [Deltaproteobacteria bacterium]
MSYIHEALRKAQKEKDSRRPDHHRPFSGTAKKRGVFSGRSRWLVALGVILLAFTLYSWLDFRSDETVQAPENAKAEVGPGPEDSSKANEFYERGRLFHRIGRLGDARGFYEKALMLDPGSVRALNDLGVLHMQGRNYLEAQKNLEHAIQLKPDYVDAYYNLACLHALKGEKTESLTHLKKAVSLDAAVRQWAQEDRDLQTLKGEPEFQEIIGGNQINEP